MLAAITWLARRRHGPLSAEYWNAPPIETRSVPRAEVVDLLGGTDGDIRAAVDTVLDRLAEVGLVLPSSDPGEVVVGLYVHHAHAEDTGLGRAAMDLIRAYFNAPDVH
ncbi:hypothetical protein [Nocardia brasiliensis]|nr:hypothetical protein [Nocardia brasiliensis]